MRRKIALASGHLLVLVLFFHGVSKAFAAEYTGSDIGGGSDGGLVAVPGGYDLSSRSRDIGGNGDQFHFGYEKRTGNFDVQVRLEGVSITDAFVHAGLMARTSTDTGSPFAAMFASSALLGTFFESRATTNGTSTQVTPRAVFPVNYPQMYLRLKRSGSGFTGYASFDGNAWQQIATATISMPAEILLGIAVSSLNTNAVATAQFRDIKDVTGATTYTYKPVETLGPSNRRTGMIFSEIMYHPAPRSDGENIEFIEIFNAESLFIDLTGWRLSGAVNYQFPDGFRLESGQFAVIAANPDSIKRVYGYPGALGPYEGHLDAKGETLKLLNRAGAIRLEVSYQNDAPWPVAADGAGHSIVLARPSYGEDDPRAWAASDRVGGSPGEVDAHWPNPSRTIVINEVLANSGSAFVELYNASVDSVDLSGCILTDEVTTNRFQIAPGTFLPARGFITFTQGELNFALRASGNTLYLLSPTRDRVIDVIRYTGQEKEVSLGRAPDGSPRMTRLASATPAAANATRRIEDVVINELMYHSITGEDADTYVELHNASSKEVDVSGWKLIDGIDYKIPEGKKIAPGGFLVIAEDAAHLISLYAQLNTNNTLGDFDGKLSHNGEHIALAKRDFATVTNALGGVTTNAIYITVSEVTYVNAGRWSELADGGGSSLELTDPRNDTTLAGSWSASDESQKAPWTTIDVTSRSELGNGVFPANRLQIIMQGAGECLVDDVELIPSGSTNILVNGDFEIVTNNWRFFGNHSKSAFESAAAFSGQNGLHVRAPGDGDTANNAIRGNLVRNLPSSGTATLRAKVRWVSGWPEVLFRVRGNWLEVPARMEVPKQLGTPGLPNSRRVANAPPAIYDVTHSPLLPRANEAVVVTCRVSDPDGVGAPQVRYRVDPNQALTTLAMHDDGFDGDALAGDGIYSASIPGQTARNRMAFQIRAADDSATAATSIFPPDAPARECLIVWDDVVPFGTFAHYHMWNTAATDTARGGSDLDNTFRDATLVYGNARVIYNVGFRDKGSPYHNGGGDFSVTVPGDEKLLGIDDRIFASTGNGNNEQTDIRGDVAGWVAEQMGIPFLHSHYMRLYRNAGASPFREVMYDMEQPNRYYAKSWFNGGGVKDDLFKVAIWFEFDDLNAQNFNSTGATLQNFVSNGQYKLARYRWNWQLRPSTETANDYTAVFRLAAAANSSSDRTRVLPYLADMEEWMRVFGYHRVTGNWDSYTYDVGQNMYLYAPLGQPATMLPWDIDFVLGDGHSATQPSLFTSGTDPVMQQVFNLPLYKRMLWRAYQDAVNGSLVPAKFQPQIDARRNALRKNNVSPANPNAHTTITSYMNARRNYIAGQVARADASTFAITSNNGTDFTSSNSSVSLIGVAPFAVASIEVNGVPFAINWTSATNWQISVPLGGVTNVLQIAGRDLRGQVLTGAVDTITVLYDGPVPQPQDWVVINEINYHSLASKADFVEIYNRHPSFAFDLSGFRLDGIDYDFPNGTLIQPNGYLVVAEHKASFAAAYDPLLPVLGPYSGNLQNDGETLRLIRPGATEAESVIIDEVRYSDSAPWPVVADGFGPSLQLIDAAQDNWRAGDWAATAAGDPNPATPGKPNSVRSTLEAFPRLWINEIQPTNTAGITDNQGEHEPWIELFNAESSAIDLSNLYLSDEATNLTKWQFPAGARIDPGAFLVVWADGQTSQNTAAQFHTNFRLASPNGTVLLSRIQGANPAVMDYAVYQVTTVDATYGSYPDGDPRHRRMLFVPTPGAPNNPLIPNVTVAINEWMAATQSIIRDPADGQFENWFELYNYGTNVVDLSGFYFTHTESDKTMFRIPPGYRLNPAEFRLVWADAQPEQNSSTNDLHVNFTLDADGDEIALYTPDEQLVRLVNFGEQTPNISEGLFPDGAESQSAAFLTATPGAHNIGQFANRPPAITPVAKQTVDEGQTLSVQIVATDLDVPAQALSYSLKAAPPGAIIDAQTGLFSWTPTEDQGPGNYLVTVHVKDNGSPVQAGNVTFSVTVREFNLPPIIAPVGDQTIDEGLPFSLAISVQDSDIPAQKVTLSLVSPPVGASLDPANGEFQWTPSEDQGPGVYTITVRATDDGEPAAASTRSFNVTVRDINNAPVIADIPIQTATEGIPFSLQVQAHDPDNPPASLVYALENAPPGMIIDPNTGLITWTPAEADAPQDYNVSVHVSEPGGEPSASTTFLLGTKEVNLPPTIDAISDLIVQPGDLIAITVHASDADLPAQSLTYTGIGLPAGAALSASGGFAWAVPQDPPVGTNRITIRVTDDATPAQNAETSFNIIVRAPLRVAINEIMHHPATPNAEFIELANYSSVTTADLSGWRLEGYDYTFPAGTVLSPGAFLCVARDVTAFRAAYGSAGILLGAASITIPPDGGVLRLIRPGKPGFPDEVVDETLFSLAPPWPGAAASQGASLQLIDPWEDHRRVNNWSASAVGVTNTPVSVVPMNATWKYWQSDAFPGAAWTTGNFNDAAWPSGGALLYVEGDPLPAPKITPLTLGRLSYYFRTHFTFNGNPDGATLRINTIIDDGAVFYLNGQEVYRLAMPAGTIQQTTLASRTVGNAAAEGPFEVPATGLRSGDNLLAVEVHQAAAGSSDIVLGASLDVIALKSVSFTPNAPNSVLQDLDYLPPVWINEIAPNNTAGLMDITGDFQPWIELFNSADAPAVLNGWALTDDFSSLTKWVLPDNTTIPAHGFLLVWMDGDPSLVSPGQLHAGFKIRPDAGVVALTARQNARQAIVDYVSYSGMAANQSIGSKQDGNPLTRAVFTKPSPAGTNIDGNSTGAPRIAVTATSGNITLSWVSQSGRAFRIESCSGNSITQWVTVSSGTGDGGTATFSEKMEQTQSRFYRVVLP